MNVSEKLIAEAEAVGLEFIGPAIENDANYRTYKIISCGHTKEIKTGHVRNNVYECTVCMDLKLDAEAEAVGLEVVAKCKKKGYRTYKIKQCQHIQDISTSNVRKNNFRCAICTEIFIANEASAVGLTLLGPLSKRHYRLYRINACNHTQPIHMGHVRNNSYKCHTCLDLKLKDEAEAVGLTFIGKGKNKLYRKYRFNGCQHIQQIQTGHVRKNNFQCQKCSVTSRSQPSFIYLLKISALGQSWLKLGFAKNINIRIGRYGLPENSKVEVIRKKQVESGTFAHEIELAIHKKFSRLRLCIVQHHQKGGGTECYPTLLLNSLVSSIDQASLTR